MPPRKTGLTMIRAYLSCWAKPVTALMSSVSGLAPAQKVMRAYSRVKPGQTHGRFMIIFAMEARIVKSQEGPGVQEPAAIEERSDAVCSRCGNFGAELIYGDLMLCSDCYYISGSCCLEFGADDLWSQP